LRSKFIGSLFLVFFIWLFLFFLKSYKSDQDCLEKVEANITNAYISGKAISKSLSQYIENKAIQDKPALILSLIRNTLQHGLSPKEKIFISTLSYLDENHKITPIGISKAQQTLPIFSKSNEIEILSTVRTNNLFTGKLTVVISLDGFTEEVRDLGYNMIVSEKLQDRLEVNISLNMKKRLLSLFDESIYDHLLIILLLFGIYILFQRGTLKALDDYDHKQKILLQDNKKTNEMHQQKEAIHNHIFQHHSSLIEQIKIYKELLDSNDPAFSQKELIDKINQTLDGLQSLNLSTLDTDEFTLKECVEKATTSLYQKVFQKGINIQTHFEGCDIYLKSPHQNVVLLLIANLLNQSIERLPKQGKIDIYLNAEQKGFLKIKDNGYRLKLPDPKASFTRGETLFSLDQNFLKTMASANALHLEFYLENDSHIAQLGEAKVLATQRLPLKVVR